MAKIDRCRPSINSRNYTRPIVFSNLPQEEKQALQDLRHRSDITIKPADRGGVFVVWSRELYNQEAHRQTVGQPFLLTPSQVICDVIAGAVERNINAVSHKPTRVPI